MKTIFRLCVVALCIQATLLSGQEQSYKVGDKIDSDVTVFNADGEKVKMLDLVQADTRLIYLVILGGPSLNPERGSGGIWCEDSFNDLPVSTYNYFNFSQKGVLFVPVVCPPVYHERRFGYDKGFFLQEQDSENDFLKGFQAFTQATKDLQKQKIIPFDNVFFDPHFSLLFNHNRLKDRQNYPLKDVSWLGRFKPEGDTQIYSTPTIWLILPDGTIVEGPFYGNRYSHRIRKITYTVRDIEKAIKRHIF